MAESNMEMPLPDEEFRELAEGTWAHIYSADQVCPKMPTRSDLEGALVRGDLDDGIPELSKRLYKVVVRNDCPPYLQRYVAERHPLEIPDHLTAAVGTTHDNIISAIDAVNLQIEVRRELILAFMANSHALWQEMLIYNTDLKHPLEPLIAAWFKLTAPYARVRHPGSATPAVSTSLTEELFQGLAASTWRQRVRQRDDEDMPELPSLASFRASIMEGELDEGLPEFHRRVSDIEDVYDPDDLANTDEVHIRMEGRDELYVVEHGNKIRLDSALIDRTSQILIAYSLNDCHYSWVKATEEDPDLKHPIAPLIEQWFKRPVHVEPSSTSE